MACLPVGNGSVQTPWAGSRRKDLLGLQDCYPGDGVDCGLVRDKLFLRCCLIDSRVIFFFFSHGTESITYIFFNLEATLQYCIGFAVLNLERLGGWDKSFGLPNLVCTANKGVSDVSRLCLWKCFWMLIYKWHQECHWGGKGRSPHFLSCKTEIRISNMAYSWGWEDGIR